MFVTLVIILNDGTGTKRSEYAQEPEGKPGSPDLLVWGWSPLRPLFSPQGTRAPGEELEWYRASPSGPGRDDGDPAVCRGPAGVPDAGPQAHPAPAACEQERRQARARGARGVPQDQEEAPQEEYAFRADPDPTNLTLDPSASDP